MSKEVMLSHRLEKDIRVTEQEKKDEGAEIERLTVESERLGRPSPLFGYVRNVGKLARVKLFGTMMALHESYRIWPTLKGVEDDWENVAPSMTGLSLDQCRDYRDTYARIYANPDVPAFVKKALPSKTAGAQTYLAPAAASGDLTNEQWHRIVDAETEAEVKEIVREARGTKTSSNSRYFIKEDRDHKLWGKQGDGPYVNLGILLARRSDMEGDDYDHRVRAVLIPRIRKACGIKEE